MMAQFITYPDRAALMAGLADRIATELRDSLAQFGRASLSLPGGNTPAPMFAHLCNADLDWARVAVFLNDERWVDEDSPRSNTAFLKAAFLQSQAARARLIPLFNGAPNPEAGIADLEAGLGPHLPISVLVLGMGADMHTASLFPDGDNLIAALAEDAPILMPMRAQGAGEPRVTLTARVLRQATHVHLLITGAEKRDALARAGDLPETQAPVRAILDHAVVHWAE